VQAAGVALGVVLMGKVRLAHFVPESSLSYVAIWISA
jgi:hypothetical protein